MFPERALRGANRAHRQCSYFLRKNCLSCDSTGRGLV